MIREEYSPYKLVHHPEIINQMRQGIQPVPLQVHLIPTNKCNQNCLICAYRRTGFQSNQTFCAQDELSYEKLTEFIYDLAELGTRSIQFTGGGEPLLHPNIKDVFKLTDRLGIKSSLVTNGMLFDEEIQSLVSNFSWVRFSLDSATPLTFSKVRQVAEHNFEAILNNIRRYVKHNKNTIIGISFVIQEHNYKETYQATQLFKDIGVDNIRISVAFTPQYVEYFKEFRMEAQNQAEKAMKLEDNNFAIFNLFNERTDQLFSGFQNYTYCYYKDLVPYIGADENVYRCCVKAYTHQGYVGSIKESSFKEFWLSKTKIDNYRNHSPMQNCKHPCMFENKNQFMGYCTKRNPKHMEFV